MNNPTALELGKTYQIDPELTESNDTYKVAEIAEDGYYLHRIIDGKIGGTDSCSEWSWVSNYQLENFGEMVEYKA